MKKIISKNKLNQFNHLNQEGLIELIENIEDNSNIKLKSKKKKISENIINYLLSNGDFIKTNVKFYYFYKETTHLYEYKTSEFEYMINIITGINLSDTIFTYILKDIEVYIYENGNEVSIKQFSYYDIKKNYLYIYNNGNQIIKITKDKITVINNGDDGIIFIGKDNYEKWDYIDDYNKNIDYLDDLINSINFNVVDLDKKEQQFILKQYIYSLFFGDLLSNRPVLTFIGEKGSGKSFFFELLQIIFFGSNSSIGNLPTKEEDLKVNLMNNYLCFFDNVDDKVGDNKIDILCSVSTGVSIKIRKLYSNGEQIENKVNCFLGITSRNPTFKRDDFTDRLLLFNLNRRDNFSGTNQIKQKYIDNRNNILSKLCVELQGLLINLEKVENYKTNFRMSDFANLVFNFNKNNIPYIEEIFNGLKKNQENLAISTDSLLEIIQSILDEEYKFNLFDTGKSYKALELHKIFSEYAKNNSHLQYGFKSALSLGRTLSARKDIYKQLYNINIIINKERSNVTTYLISKGILGNEVNSVFNND